MRVLHVVAAAAAAVATILATPSAGHAQPQVTVPFSADSGDNCRYGFTEGTLTWRFGTSPLPLTAVAVKGRLADRPLPADPGPVCRDDGLLSIATFAAFSGNVQVDRDLQRANNEVVGFEFLLGEDSTVTRIDRIVIQVCRHRPTSTVPVYCGRPAEYRIPPVVTL
jgi:hypothetical protein